MNAPRRFHDPTPSRSRGFTLVETSIALAIFGILLAVFASAALDLLRFAAGNDTHLTVELEATRVISRSTEVLRESGRVEIDSIEYPRVIDGGAALEFRILTDLDGNGFPFDEESGELEWDPDVYTVRVDAEGNAQVERDGTPVHHLGRHVRDLQVTTIDEDPAVGLNEIRLSFATSKQTPRGELLERPVTLHVQMRN